MYLPFTARLWIHNGLTWRCGSNLSYRMQFSHRHRTFLGGNHRPPFYHRQAAEADRKTRASLLFSIFVCLTHSRRLLWAFPHSLLIHRLHSISGRPVDKRSPPEGLAMFMLLLDRGAIRPCYGPISLGSFSCDIRGFLPVMRQEKHVNSLSTHPSKTS